MGKYMRISSYIRKLFLIYDFAIAPLWISLYIWGKFHFIFYQCTMCRIYSSCSLREGCAAQRACVSICKVMSSRSAKMPRGVITGLPAGQHFCRHTVSDSQIGKIDCALSVSWVANCYRHFVYIQKNIRLSRGWIYATEGENVVQAYLHRHCYCAVLNFLVTKQRTLYTVKKG